MCCSLDWRKFEKIKSLAARQKVLKFSLKPSFPAFSKVESRVRATLPLLKGSCLVIRKQWFWPLILFPLLLILCHCSHGSSSLQVELYKFDISIGFFCCCTAPALTLLTDTKLMITSGHFGLILTILLMVLRDSLPTSSLSAVE